MRRREFLRDSSLVALGLGAFGSIAWQGDRFVGNSPTATDILGPFYRPGAPFRQDLNPPDFRGRVLTLFGRIVGDDGRSPQVESVVETWQCKPDGFYDNVSDEFLYRGQQRTGKDGEYLFITTVPVPEPVDDARTIFRPAHIHLLISTPGQQDLITQVYFSGDPHLDTDPSTQAGLAINRVLTLERVDETSDRIRFDIRLRREYLPDEGGFRRVAGVYRMSDGSLDGVLSPRGPAVLQNQRPGLGWTVVSGREHLWRRDRRYRSPLRPGAGRKGDGPLPVFAAKGNPSDRREDLQLFPCRSPGRRLRPWEVR